MPGSCSVGGSSSGGGNSSTYSITGLCVTTFNNGGYGTDGYIDAITIQSNEKILIGGAFENYNGVDVPDCLIRLYSEL